MAEPTYREPATVRPLPYPGIGFIYASGLPPMGMAIDFPAKFGEADRARCYEALRMIYDDVMGADPFGLAPRRPTVAEAAVGLLRRLAASGCETEFGWAHVPGCRFCGEEWPLVPGHGHPEKHKPDCP